MDNEPAPKGLIGKCEGCSVEIDYVEDIGDRLVDDPALMWCKPCAPVAMKAAKAYELERAIRELDARDCRNINFYDGGDFNYGRGR